MKTYTVKIIGIQAHISSSEYDLADEAYVNLIIDQYWDGEESKPVIGIEDAQHLDSDHVIVIEEEL